MVTETWKTVGELVEETQLNEYSVRKALIALNIEPRRDLADRRFFVYPPGTAQRILTWIQQQK
jgi:hypothetical protein